MVNSKLKTISQRNFSPANSLYVTFYNRVIKRRLTSLEVDNAEVQNSTEVLKVQLAHAETKIYSLEKEVNLMKTENSGLKSLLAEMKDEFRAFQREMVTEIYELKNGTNKTLLAIDIKKSISNKDNSLDTTCVRSEKSPATHREDHKGLDLTKSLLSESPIFCNSPFADKEFSTFSSGVANRSRFFESSPMRNRVMEVKPFGQIQTSFNLGSPNEAIVEEDAQSSESPHFFTPNNLSKNKSCFTNSSHSPQSNGSASLGEERKSPQKNFESPQSVNGGDLIKGGSGTFRPEKLFEIFVAFGLKKGDVEILYNSAEDDFDEKIVITEDIKNAIVSNLKTEEESHEEYICSFAPQKQELLLAKWHEDVEAFNPQNRLYAICLQKANVIYCLFTYYPIARIAFEALKMLTTEDFKSDVREILQTPAPQINKPIIEISLNRNNVKLEYNCFEEEQAYLEISAWKSSKVFSRFGFEDLNLILSGLLLDKPVVLVSENMTLLTASLNTLLGLMSPFKYQYDIESNPQSLESSRPLILCVNKKEEVFKEKDIYKCKDKICVLLDSKVIYMNKKMNDFSMLEVTGEDLKSAYGEINEEKFEVISDIENLKERKKRSSLIVPQKIRSNEEIIKREKCVVNVFKGYKEFLQKNVMEEIVKIYEGNVMENSKLEEFLCQFKQTQSFWTVLDELSNK